MKIKIAALALLTFVGNCQADDWTEVAQSRGSPIMGKIIQTVGKDSSGNTSYLLSVWGADPNANGGYGPTGTNVLVVVGPGDHADGDMIGSHYTRWTGGALQPTDKWYYAGVYSYTTVTGATATVRVYTPDLDWAAKRLADQASGN